MTADQIIWRDPGSGSRTEEEWNRLVEHLLQSLSAFLRQQIVLIEREVLDSEALFCRIRSAATIGGPLSIGWEGRLGLEVIEGQSHVSVSLFLFSQGRRLSAALQAGSYLELVYERTSDGTGQWRSDGWQEDIYDEYRFIDTYSGDL
jgi:hypothetical protein